MERLKAKIPRMDSSFVPPPLPPQVPRKSSKVTTIVIVVVAFLVVAMAAAGVGGYFLVKRVQTMQKLREERIQAAKDIEKSTQEERQKMAESLKNGDNQGAMASGERLRAQLDKAANLGGLNAESAQALSNFMRRMQSQTAEYQSSVQKLQAARVFYWEVKDRDGLEEDRKIVQEFEAENAKLQKRMDSADVELGAELDKLHASPKIKASTIADFKVGFDRTVPYQRRVRACDKTLGDAALATIDLLEASWGKWRRDASGKLIFQDTATLAKFNEQVKKIQDAGAEQAQAQNELAKVVSGGAAGGS